jgi:hypothetical protein
MSTKQPLVVRIQIRRDSSANWFQDNPILGNGEPGYDWDLGKLKIGDGAQPWNALPYQGADALGLTIAKMSTYPVYVAGEQHIQLPADALDVFDVTAIERDPRPGHENDVLVRSLHQANYYLDNNAMLIVAAASNLISGDTVAGYYYKYAAPAPPVTPVPAASPRNVRLNGDYTLAATDAGSILSFLQGATCTIPSHTQAPFPLGAVVEISQEGAGQVLLVAADPTVVLRSYTGYKTAGQWASLQLRQRAQDEWVVTGGVV